MEKLSTEPRQQTEGLIPNRPRLRNIEDTLVLLESEEDPDGEKINWKDLYEKVGTWETGLGLSETEMGAPSVRPAIRPFFKTSVKSAKVFGPYE